MSFTAHNAPGHASPGRSPPPETEGNGEGQTQRGQGHLPGARTSVNDQSGLRHLGSKFVVHLRQWAFWRQRPRVTAYMLTCELAAIACIVLATVTAPNPTGADWLLFVPVALCATAPLQLSRRQEETR